MTSIRAIHYTPRGGPPTLDLTPVVTVEPRRTITARERQVWALLATGATDREIARDLGICVSTIKYHTRMLMLKLDVQTRTELAAVFYGAVPYGHKTHQPRS